MILQKKKLKNNLKINVLSLVFALVRGALHSTISSYFFKMNTCTKQAASDFMYPTMFSKENMQLTIRYTLHVATKQYSQLLISLTNGLFKALNANQPIILMADINLKENIISMKLKRV